MNNKENTIWIDMTDLSKWQGHFTGIQRVVYSIASRYARSSKEVNYFVFNEGLKSFEVFDFDVFEAKIASQKSTIDTVGFSTKQRLKSKAKEVYLKSPNAIKNVLRSPRVKGALIRSLHYYRKAKSHKIRSNSHINKTDKASFKKGDTVLVLGNSWDRPDLVIYLSKIRDQKQIKIYQVIYDLIPIYQPQAFNAELFKIYSNNMFEVVTNSDGLLAISESSKRDAVRFCRDIGVDCPPIDVIRLGDEVPISERPVQPFGLPQDEEFLLCVGTIEARKNHTILYYAWKEGLRRGVNMPHIVIVGRRGWYTGDIVHTIKTDPDTRGRFHFMENVNDDELVWLYQNTLFTVYPSYYEGWGLPVAESAAMGKLCIASDQSSMPEIAGDLMEYFSPFDSSALVEKIMRFMNDEHRTLREERIRDIYMVNSWDDCFAQVDALINKYERRKSHKPTNNICTK